MSIRANSRVRAAAYSTIDSPKRTVSNYLFANRQRLNELGYDDQFLRLWEYYLCYCEGGFLERQLSDLQITFIKPLNTDP